jgi:hypothetical protein
MGFLLPLLGLNTRLSAQQIQQAAHGFVLGVTGSSPERPVGDVSIEVRRSYAAIATWSYWRGAPLPKAPTIQGRSDKQGRFRIPVAAGYEYEVSFSKPGYKDSKGFVYANRPFLGFMEKGVSGPLREGTQPATAPSTSPSNMAHGKLKDAVTGKPIVGAEIREFWGTKSLTHSSKAGEFAVHCTAEQAKNDLLVWAKGYRLSVVPQAAFGKQGGVEIGLQAGVLLSGQLVDAKGKPQVGRWVVLGTDVPVGETIYGGVVLWTRTDAEGRYGFSALASGWRYWVRTLLPGGTPFEIADGKMPEGPMDLGLATAVPSFSVEGRVTDPDGKPLLGGRVHVLRLFGGKPVQLQVVRTTPSFPIDGQGRFRIPGLAPYSHELCFFLEGLEHAVRVVKPPEKGAVLPLSVQMGSGRSLRGVVVDAQDKPVDGALLRGMVWSDQEIAPIVPHGDLSHMGRFIAGNMRVLTRPDGTFLLERLRSQLPLRIICSKKGYKSVKLRVAATPDNKPLRIQLR